MSEVRKVGVVGAGLMGSGIAQILAQSGIEVLLLDSRAGAAAEAHARVAAQFAKLVEKGRMQSAAASSASGRKRSIALRTAGHLSSGWPSDENGRQTSSTNSFTNTRETERALRSISSSTSIAVSV